MHIPTLPRRLSLAAALCTAALISANAHAGVTITPLTAAQLTANATTPGDLFDVSTGTVVTSDSPEYNATYSAANAIGGTNSFIEPTNLIFTDSPMTIEFVAFKTPTPVTIAGYNLYLGQSPFGSAATRGFGHVELFGSIDGVTYASLGSTALADNYSTAYGSYFLEIASTFAATTYQYFRFEGTVQETGKPFQGGRLVELDGIPGSVTSTPEPAAFALFGMGAVGIAAARRRAR